MVSNNRHRRRLFWQRHPDEQHIQRDVEHELRTEPRHHQQCGKRLSAVIGRRQLHRHGHRLQRERKRRHRADQQYGAGLRTGDRLRRGRGDQRHHGHRQSVRFQSHRRPGHHRGRDQCQRHVHEHRLQRRRVPEPARRREHAAAGHEPGGRNHQLFRHRRGHAGHDGTSGISM